MASLQERNGSFRILFRYGGRQHSLNAGKVSRREADLTAAGVDKVLLRLEQGLLSLPPGLDVVDFVRHDGKPPVTNAVTKPGEAISLTGLRDRYLATHAGSLEANTLAIARIHFQHLIETLKPGFLLGNLQLSDLQGHVERRKATVATATIEKEIRTLRTAWNWGVRMGLVTGTFPGRGLVYPKTDEKPPFQTRAEIERHLQRMTAAERATVEPSLWESLYLTRPEIDQLLAYVQSAAAHAWIYPMVVTAAHTGARRSELLRLRIDDVDFEGGTIVLREMKRVKGKRSTRRVPLSPLLSGVLRRWMAEHPGGPHLFCHAAEVARSKKRSRTTGYVSGPTRPKTLTGRLATVRSRERRGFEPLTEGEAHTHLRRTLADSPWRVLRGWHTLRHSFISLCASRGTDQRLIDEWVGHTTEAMRRRYRHLYPSVQRAAIASVFGGE